MVLTAAHCFTDATVPLSVESMHIRIGSLDRTTGGVVTRAKRIVTNDFRRQPPARDIALIELATPVTGGGAAQIAVAPPPPGTAVRLMSWRAATGKPDAPTPDTLSDIVTHIRPRHDCARNDIADSELCVDGRGGIGAYSGDSGAPAVIDTPAGVRIAGVGSRAPFDNNTRKCGLGPGVYTDVSGYQAWIADTIGHTPATEPASTPDSSAAAGSR